MSKAATVRMAPAQPTRRAGRFAPVVYCLLALATSAVLLVWVLQTFYEIPLSSNALRFERPAARPARPRGGRDRLRRRGAMTNPGPLPDPYPRFEDASVKRRPQSSKSLLCSSLMFCFLVLRDLSPSDVSELSGLTLVQRNEVAFSLLFALDEAACAAAHGGVRTEVGAIYFTALNSGHHLHRARPPDVFHRVTCRWV